MLKSVVIFAAVCRDKFNKILGRYSSGQRGQTVNLLCELRRFESCSPHKKAQLDTGLFLFMIYYIFPSLAKMNNNTIGIANNITISRLSINK